MSVFWIIILFSNIFRKNTTIIFPIKTYVAFVSIRYRPAARAKPCRPVYIGLTAWLSRCASDAWRHRANIATLARCAPLSRVSEKTKKFWVWERLWWLHYELFPNLFNFNLLCFFGRNPMKDDDFTKSFWRKFCTTGRIPLSCVFALDRRSDRRTAGLRHRAVFNKTSQ